MAPFGKTEIGESFALRTPRGLPALGATATIVGTTCAGSIAGTTTVGTTGTTALRGVGGGSRSGTIAGDTVGRPATMVGAGRERTVGSAATPIAGASVGGAASTSGAGVGQARAA